MQTAAVRRFGFRLKKGADLFQSAPKMDVYNLLLEVLHRCFEHADVVVAGDVFVQACADTL